MGKRAQIRYNRNKLSLQKVRIKLGCKTLPFIVAIMALSCDQTKADFPDSLGANSPVSFCGEWYPGGPAEADGGISYAIEKGQTFPCLVWNSVRQDAQSTWFNAGEVYLRFYHGASAAKALVMIISGQSCPTCVELISEIKKVKAEFDENAMMLSAALPTYGAESGFTLDEAEEILVKHDGWPPDWFVTNDAERHLVGYESFPWIVVVRLKDMEVVVKTNFEYGPGNVDELLALIKSF